MQDKCSQFSLKPKIDLTEASNLVEAILSPGVKKGLAITLV